MVKNIIFDLGNVLVNVHYDKFFKDLIHEGVEPPDVYKFFNDSLLRGKFESGQMSRMEFLRYVKLKIGKNVSRKVFLKHFTEMFSEITQMKILISRLSKKKQFKMFLLSNTNPIHFEYIREQFPHLNLLHKFGLSYKYKILKPDPRLYKKVLRDFRIKAKETLFVDDLKDNCKTAQKLGFNVIHFRTFNSFKKEFDRFLEENK